MVPWNLRSEVPLNGVGDKGGSGLGSTYQTVTISASFLKAACSATGLGALGWQPELGEKASLLLQLPKLHPPPPATLLPFPGRHLSCGHWDLGTQSFPLLPCLLLSLHFTCPFSTLLPLPPCSFLKVQGRRTHDPNSMKTLLYTVRPTR